MSLITASASILTNSINPLQNSNNMTIGSTINTDKLISIGRTDGTGSAVRFPSSIRTQTISATSTTGDVALFQNSTGAINIGSLSGELSSPCPIITLGYNSAITLDGTTNITGDLTLDSTLTVGNGIGDSGMVLASGGVGTPLSWVTRAVIQSGETAVGAMSSAVTGTVSYGSSYAVKPSIQLTMNLNGTGTTIIPVAVSSDTIVSGQYTGFTWISGTTSSTATISWYVTYN